MNSIQHADGAPRAPVNLRSIDLNLLVIFEALVEERSVGKAAARLGITSSAVSHALRRLRTQFNDPLLLRTAEGMSPTPEAVRLARSFRKAFTQADALTWLAELDDQLEATGYLFGQNPSLADMALRPFVRQYARIDESQWNEQPWPHLQAWLQRWIDSALFAEVMETYPGWVPGTRGPVFAAGGVGSD